MKKKREKEARKEEKKKGSALRFLGWGGFLPIAAETGMGVLLLVLSDTSMSALSIVTGVVFSLLGVLLLATAFLMKKAGILRLIFGVAFIGFAVWLFVRPSEAVGALFYVLLALLLLRAVLGAWTTLTRTHAERTAEKVVFAGCLAVAVAAFVLFFPPMSLRTRCILGGVLFLVLAALALFARLLRMLRPKERGEEPKDETKKGKKKEEAPAPQEAQAEQAASEEAPQELPRKKRRFLRGKREGGKGDGS